MTHAELRASLDLWERREARAHHNHQQHPKGSERYEHWVAAERKAEEMVDRRRDQLGVDSDNTTGVLASNGAPRLVGWNVTGINPRNVFGALGPERKVTTHYAASPRARNLEEGIRLTRSFDAFHASRRWGGLSYHYLIPDTGEVILGRSTFHKGAHVGGMNSGNVGVNFFSTAGDQPTEAQAETFMWLLANAHTPALPAPHRTDLDLRNADIRGHRDWPSQATGCPGFFTPEHLRRIAR
jgi:hypothetical protein